MSDSSPNISNSKSRSKSSYIKKKEKRQYEQLEFRENVKLCLKYFWRGVCDAFTWPSSLITIYGSNTLRNRTLKCFILNGVIFLGSIFFFKNFTLPIIHFFLGNPVLNSKGEEYYSPFITNFLDSIINLIYQLFWVYPIFLLSFILNSMWYQDIADRVYSGETISSNFNYNRLLRGIADEIYRAILFMNYLIFSTIIYIIPKIGPFCSFVYFCWIYSFYSFEYKWINKGWSLEQRINYFEERWAYFAGFGFIFTSVTFFVDVFFSAGIFALFFPIYIIMANNAIPVPRNNKKSKFSPLIPYRLPIFWMAKKMNDKLINTFHNRTLDKNR